MKDKTDEIIDTLKDYSLKLVANAHSEMSDEQWSEWINEHTETYAHALWSNALSLIKESRIEELEFVLTMLEDEKEPTYNSGGYPNAYGLARNDLRNELTDRLLREIMTIKKIYNEQKPLLTPERTVE